jgi:hypothetical protein
MKAHRYATAGLLAAGLLIAVPVTTSGQGLFDYQRFEQRAYDNGFREGLMQGERDARIGREFSYVRADDFQRADEGYRREDGDLADYRRLFRQGFERGYTEGFDRLSRDSAVVAPRETVPSIRMTPAEQIGFRDGYETGLKDLDHREIYDPLRSDRYRSADHDYDRRYGSREEFKSEYRIGFEEGYARAYRGR